MHRRVVACLLAASIFIGLTFALPAPASAASDGIIRILLSTMAGLTSQSIRLDGVYGIEGRPDIALTKGRSVVVTLENGQLNLNTGSGPIPMGSGFTIKEYASDTVNLLTMYNPKNGTASYRGDLLLKNDGNTIRFISRVFMEDYIKSVIPHEMSNLFPLQALKAQAVCARSYATKRMGSSAAYDMVDNANDQVYKGYRVGDTTAHQAVNETAGVVLTYGGQIIDAYYSSSNGGQTELPTNVWTGPNPGIVACYAMVDDPYDLRNPMSSLNDIPVATNGQTYSSPFAAIMRSAASRQLAALGVSVPEASVSITGVQAMSLTNPRVVDARSAGISRYYRTLLMTVTVAQYGGPLQLTISLQDEVRPAATDNLQLFTLSQTASGWTLTARRWGHGVGLSQRGAQQMANEGLGHDSILNFYYPGAQQTQSNFVRAPYEQKPTGDIVIGMGTVMLSKASSSLNIRKSASTSSSVAGSVKHGTQVEVMKYEGDWVKVRSGKVAGYVQNKYLTVQLTPAPTPEPTPGGQALYTAYITLQSDLYLRMRKEASTDSQVLTTIPKDAQVDVLGTSGEWAMIRYDILIGYVKTQYLRMGTSVTPAPTPVATPTPTPAPIMLAKANVATEVKAGMAFYHNTLRALAKGEVVEVLAEDTYWLTVKVGDTKGYAYAEYMTKMPLGSATAASGGGTQTVATPAPAGTSTKATPAKIKTKTEGANVSIRSKAAETSSRIGSVKDGATIVVLEKGAKFSKIKAGSTTGYISNDYIAY